MTPVNWQLNTKIPPAVFRRYTLANLERGLEQIKIGPVRNDPLYIVGSGPSLRETWHELKDRPGEIWALNAAFDWLCSQGIRPDYGVCIACEDEILRYFQDIEASDKFLFASQTHPVLVDRALDKGAKVKFWHVACPSDWDDMPKLPEPRIYGGGTIGTRAIDLAWVMGFRNIHLLGIDASLSMDGRIAVDTPMYDDRRDSLRTFLINGRAFVAMPSHARQVEDFSSVIRALTGLNMTLYGDGMLQWSLNNAAESGLERN